jgi:inorganic pyrophosphatase
MDTKKIQIGDKAPQEFNMIVEIPAGVAPVKYELDKDSGALVVDRFVSTSMFYPCNYGFIPNTLGADGDPLDVLLISNFPVFPMSVVKVRPVGVLLMEDESGGDEKILAVPVSKITPYYDNIKTYTDLNPLLLEQLKHFFENYKDLEKGKWVKLSGYGDIEQAKSIVIKAIADYKE